MKKTISILLSTMILFSIVCNAFASNANNRIFADSMTIEASEQLTVAVKIENNEGFMGFAIVVTYDADVFTPVSVSKGSMLSGMFDDSIETSTDNSFKVVFTGTENIIADGVLFNIIFDVADDVSGKYEIELSYSQQDTFNENWDNVMFNCEGIEAVVNINGTTEATTISTTVLPTQPTTRPVETTTKPVSVPSTEESTTEPVTEPTDEPSEEEKPLSVRMREWVNGLPMPLNIILGIFVIPIASIISIFE